MIELISIQSTSYYSWYVNTIRFHYQIGKDAKLGNWVLTKTPNHSFSLIPFLPPNKWTLWKDKYDLCLTQHDCTFSNRKLMELSVFFNIKIFWIQCKVCVARYTFFVIIVHFCELLKLQAKLLVTTN